MISMQKKILIVDDQEDMLYMMEAILLRNGFDVIKNSNGEVLELINDGIKPDLIILDINLGEKDGGEICYSLKKEISTKNIPIILVSAVMDLLKVSTYCGAEDYLEKPFRGQQLINKVVSNLKAA